MELSECGPPCFVLAPVAGLCPQLGIRAKSFSASVITSSSHPFATACPGCPIAHAGPLARWRCGLARPGRPSVCRGAGGGHRRAAAGAVLQCDAGRFAVRCGPFRGAMRAVLQPQTPLAVQRPVRQRAGPVAAAALRERSTAPMMVATAPSMPMRSVFTIRS